MKRDISRLQKTVSVPKEGDIVLFSSGRKTATKRTRKTVTKDALTIAQEQILEDEVKKEVQQIIILYRLAIKRQNTGATKIGKRFIRFGEAGDGDFAGYCQYTGRHVEIETKRPVGGKLSKAQLRKLDAINKAGGVGIVATSAADCLAQLKEAGVIR